MKKAGSRLPLNDTGQYHPFRKLTNRNILDDADKQGGELTSGKSGIWAFRQCEGPAAVLTYHADTALCGRSVFLDGDAPTMGTRIDVFRFLVIFLFRPYCLRPEYQFIQLVSRQTIQGTVLHDIAEKVGHEKDTPIYGIFCARSIFGACPSTVGDVTQHDPLLNVKRSLLVSSRFLL